MELPPNANRHRNQERPQGDKAKLGKAFKLADEKGLFLLVKPGVKGWAKWWRFKYRYGGNEKGLSFGTCPEVTLASKATAGRYPRKLLADDIDPGENRKAVKQAKSESAANSLDALINMQKLPGEGWNQH